MSPAQTPPADEHMLSGPQVPDSAARTLVALDAGGQFVRLERRPEEAALALVNVDEARLDAAYKAVDAYRDSFQTLLIDEIDLLRQTTDAIEAGNADAARDAARAMYDRFDPEHTRSPLFKSLQTVLSPEEFTEVMRLVDEYWKAWIDWELRNARDRSEARRLAVQDRLAFEIFQRDLRQAYERTLRPYRDRMRRMYEIVEPTQEQREAIRAIVIEYIRETRLNPTPEQRREAARRIYQILDEEDRVKLFETILAPL
jgi:hypothetical protein